MPSPQLPLLLDPAAEPAVQAEPLTGQALLDQALAALERARGEWIKKARYEAWRIILFNGEVSADDIHERCPIPEGMDGRVMGAVFGRKRFRHLRSQPSRRDINHKRIIPIWGKK